MAIYSESNQHSDGTDTETSINIDYWIKRFKQGTPIYWNDPEPIPGMDYQIDSIKKRNNEEAYITYNGGVSEAEVFSNELTTKEPDLSNMPDFENWD